MTRLNRISRYFDAPFFGALAGLCVAMLALDPMTLSPHSIDWLVRGDLAQQYLGWIAFRSSPWEFPLGSIHGYADPPGTTLGFVDAFPWFSVLMRVLLETISGLEKWFGPAGQITSLWLILSLMLQGFFAAALFNRLTPRNFPLIASGTITLILAPVWWHRMNHGHPSLCGQWLILAALCLSLNAGKPSGPGKINLRKYFLNLGRWSALQFIAAGIHPYLVAMTCAIGLAAVMERRWWLRSFGAAVAQLVTVIFVFWLFGYFSSQSLSSSGGGGGFHYFGADVLAFVNPMKMGGLLPGFLGGWNKAGEYEGYAWLGLGTLGLSLFWFSGRRRRKMQWAWSDQILVVVFLLALFAFGSNIRLGGFWLIDLETPYGLIEPVILAFRSAGRFIWPLYYLLIVQLFVHVGRVMQKRKISLGARSLFLFTVVIVNFLDNPFLRFKHPTGNKSGKQAEDLVERLATLTSMPASVVNLIGITRMILVPPYLGSMSCANVRTGIFVGKAFEEWGVVGMWAAKNSLSSNSGAFARHDTAVLGRACEVQRHAVLTNNLDPQAVYVLSAATPDPVAFAALESNAACAAGPEGLRFCRVLPPSL